MLRQSSNAIIQRLPLLCGMSSAASEAGAMTLCKSSEESQQGSVEAPRAAAQSPLLTFDAKAARLAQVELIGS